MQNMQKICTCIIDYQSRVYIMHIVLFGLQLLDASHHMELIFPGMTRE